ncbi:hypothetical protein ACFVJS_08360 [Nocardioides sp. NPDC057772]|uniref:hypothetical protein n=1 Tax=Nocardioides sp. NPDC057772 TaxID=3346245 RepID=UPI003671DFB1
MVTIAELLDWKAAEVRGAAEYLANRRGRLVDLDDDLNAARPPESWDTPNVGAVTTAHQRLRSRLLDMAAEVSDVQVTLLECAGLFDEAVKELNRALDHASSEGLTVGLASGVIMDGNTYPDEAAAKAAEKVMHEIRGAIDAALQKADQADADLAAALKAAADGKVDGGSGSIAEAITQLPPSLDGLDKSEIIRKIGDEIAVETVAAYLNAEAEFMKYQVEGAAKATYSVTASGKVVMDLTLEAGFGMGVEGGTDLAGASAEASIGVGSTVGLTFNSVAEAEKFLSGLDEAAFDLKFYEFGSVPAAVGANIIDYVKDHNPDSWKVGSYASAGGEFHVPGFKLEGEARGDAYYDIIKREVGLKVQAEVGTEFGDRNNPTISAGAKVEGEIKFDEDRVPKEFSVAGAVSGSLGARIANEIPGFSHKEGVGGDIQLKVDKDNPAFGSIVRAAQSGDMNRAADLAFDHGQVVIRQTSVAEASGVIEDVDVDLGQVGGVDIDAGGSVTSANGVWVKPAGSNKFVGLTTDDLRGGEQG